MGEGVEQRELTLRRKKRLVIVRSVKIDEFVAEIFQDGEGRGRAIDELAVCAGYGKRALENQIAVAGSTPLLRARIEFR